jgi:hypothetical protein
LRRSSGGKVCGLKHGGGAAHVAAAVLCGAVNHGVIVSDLHLVGSEFNGACAFMRDRNSSPDENYLQRAIYDDPQR